MMLAFGWAFLILVMGVRDTAGGSAGGPPNDDQEGASPPPTATLLPSRRNTSDVSGALTSSPRSSAAYNESDAAEEITTTEAPTDDKEDLRIHVMAFINATTVAPAWQACIMRMGEFMLLINETHHVYLPNPCGFYTRGIEGLRRLYREAQSPRRDIRNQPGVDVVERESAAPEPATTGTPLTSFTWVGDSTALRTFVHGSNNMLKLRRKEVVRRTEFAPRIWCANGISTGQRFTIPNHTTRLGIVVDSTSSSFDDLPLPPPMPNKDILHEKFCFHRLFFASTAAHALRRALHDEWRQSVRGGGMLSLTVGNWDMNWLMNKKRMSPDDIPKFTGRWQSYPAAVSYWTQYVREAMIELGLILSSMTVEALHEARHRENAHRLPAHQRPLVVIREQYQPDCRADRFAKPNRRFRKCKTLLSPTVIPMYRRTLEPLAWAMNIPVVRTDHLFVEQYSKCRIPDGLHLTELCALREVEMMFQAYDLMRRVPGLVQGVEALGVTPAPLRSEPAFPPVGAGETTTPSPHFAWLPSPRPFVNVSVFEAWLEARGDHRVEFNPNLDPMPPPDVPLWSHLSNATKSLILRRHGVADEGEYDSDVTPAAPRVDVPLVEVLRRFFDDTERIAHRRTRISLGQHSEVTYFLVLSGVMVLGAAAVLCRTCLL